MGDQWRTAVPPRTDIDRWLGDIEKAYEDAQDGGVPPSWLLPWVAESWSQSRRRGVNPDSAGSVVLSEAELQRRLRDFRLTPALDTLWAGLEGVAGGDRTVEVTDGDGYVLFRKGDKRSKAWRLANDFGLAVGALMDIDAMGLCGIGIALQHCVPVQVAGPYHWRRNQHGVHCSAVPILDPRRRNRPLAVVNVLGRGPIAHPDTLRLLRVVAGNVHRELASAYDNKAARLAEDAGPLDRITGWALVTDRHGWVAASHGLSAPPDRVMLPGGQQTQPGRRQLPELGRCVLEPLPGGWLARPEMHGEDDPVTRVVLDLRHPKRCRVMVTGPNITWQRPLSPKHAEILLLLAIARPDGRTGPELSGDLYGTPETPVRPELCRLREWASALLAHKPYRFSRTVRVEIRWPAIRTDLLPGSTAPGVIRLRI